eukprot:s34_g3.t1
MASDKVEEEVEEFKKPPLAAMLNSFDFESVAREVMEPQAWGYYSSGGDDEITLRDNHLAFQRITMRPRILVNVREIDMTTKILGVPASLPLYFTATALAKLAHKEGELAIVKATASILRAEAAKKAGVPYMLPTLSSYTLDEMLEARAPDQVVFSQLYVNPERSRSEEPVLYSLASYGQNGIVRMVHMLQDELQMVMRLAGTPNIPSITEKHVITTNLADHIVPLPVDNLTHKTYQGLEPAARL